MKPKIGITCNYDYRDTIGTVTNTGIPGQDWSFLANDYVNAIEEAGGLPMLIPQCRNTETAISLVNGLDGILFTGGNDIGAEHYGEESRYCADIVPMRDNQDLALAIYVLNETSLPVMGICRGHQLMNIAMGGGIIQDLEKEAGVATHMGLSHPRNEPWQQVTLITGGVLADIFGSEQIMVNSYHHQAVGALAPGAVVSARAEDGVIEGVEFKPNRFALGVQWHPEMLFTSEPQKKLFRAFVKACRH